MNISSAHAAPRLCLVVTRGPDEGARLEIDARLRVVGRARDADLVLTDLSVSRRHIDVELVAGGVRVRALPDTASFMHADASLREAVLPLGGAISVGSSVLCVLATSDRAPTSSQGHVERTEARTLLQGPAIEVKGLAAITALMAWLDDATDRATVGQALSRWSELHADAQGAVLQIEGSADDDTACDEHKKTADDVVTREGPGGTTEVTVPAHGAGRAWITYRFDRPAGAIGEPLRRLLVVAGRVCGSCLARIHVVTTMESALSDVRRAAIGSARAFLGTSAAATKLAATIPRVANSDVGVLLQGETGVGKTFVARLIHESSPRSREPLRVINCASIPDSLLEAELFGHEKGAFTGATAAREGALEAVGRGTLFLDEIGELSLSAQAKLLRALEDRKFERLGSNRTLDLRARVVCATNRDLGAMVKEGRFRGDLLFRISVIALQIPALRDRGDDLLLLANQQLADLAPSAGRRVDGFSPEAIAVIRRYPWPGNVRELRNAIEHALVLGDGSLIAPADLPETIAALAASPYGGAATGQNGTVHGANPDGTITVSLPAPLAAIEQLAIEAALKVTGGNRTKAAALLGINRATLYNKMPPRD